MQANNKTIELEIDIKKIEEGMRGKSHTMTKQ